MAASEGKCVVKISQRLRNNLNSEGTKRVGCVVLALLIFGFGVVVGQGNISFHRPYTSVSGNLPSTLDYTSVNQVYKSLQENYDGKLTTTQLLNGLKTGLANATNDPYTEYFTADQAKQFDDALNNSFSGIGAELGKDDDGSLVIVAPIANYPAAKAGLKAKDVITAINGTSTSDLSLSQAITKIRGAAGSTVTLAIVRGSQQLSFKIVRQNIQLASVTTKILKDNLGYIQISTFADDTADLMDKAAAKLQAAHVKGIVLDLRGNPGGLLTAAISVSSQWLPAGKSILQEKRGSTVVESYNSSGEHKLVGIPTVVLIDAGSASASEITAGALHDDKAAYLIGAKSYGKGVVQQIINFKDGSELKVTVASWYRPNGQNINHLGITPDQTVKLSDSDAKASNDTQLTAAEKYLQP